MGLGLLAFTAQKQGQWGFAVGMDLNSGLSALPGLGVLAAFESFVGLDTLLLVLSSLDQPGFQFPDMAHFNAPALGKQSIKLPAQASGVVRGMNFYAALNTTKSDGFRALAHYLGVDLNGTVGITLAVSLPDPATNSKLFLSVNEEIQKGTTLAGELGGLLQGGDVGAFLGAIVKTQVQGQPIEFDVTAIVLENGVLISGTVQGTIHFDPAPVQLSNLALVIGLDFEGVPSLGIAATLDVGTFDSSVALFFDSNGPGKSLVAGAISNLTLLDVATTLAGQKSFPAGLDTVLGRVGLKDLSAFSMPASVGTALDSRDLGAISNAFQQYGKVAIPSTSDRILLVINKKGSTWHLTDMTTMYHYSLSRQGDTISVDLQPQIYCVPGPLSAFIGSIQYPPGFDVVGEIDYLLLQAQVKVLISANQGIAADVDVAPIVIVNQDFFAVTGAGGKGGPHLSLATYSQPNLVDVQLRGPHFLVSGNLRLLGVDMLSVYVSITEHGLDFKVAEQVNPLLHVDLHGSFDSLTGAVHSRQDHAELVTAEARHHVALAHVDGQPAGQLDEQLVAVSMAECVVDLFEAVEVDQRQRDLPRRVCVLDGEGGLPRELRAVGQAGQRVMSSKEGVGARLPAQSSGHRRRDAEQRQPQDEQPHDQRCQEQVLPGGDAGLDRCVREVDLEYADAGAALGGLERDVSLDEPRAAAAGVAVVGVEPLQVRDRLPLRRLQRLVVDAAEAAAVGGPDHLAGQVAQPDPEHLLVAADQVAAGRQPARLVGTQALS